MHPAISTQQQRTQQTTSRKWRGAGLTAQQPIQGKIERQEKGRVYSPAETPSKQETKDKAKVRGEGLCDGLDASQHCQRNSTHPASQTKTMLRRTSSKQTHSNVYSSAENTPVKERDKKTKEGKVLRLSGCNIALPAILSAGRHPIEAMRIACYGLQASSKLNTLPPSQNKKKHETESSRV